MIRVCENNLSNSRFKHPKNPQKLRDGSFMQLLLPPWGKTPTSAMTSKYKVALNTFRFEFPLVVGGAT